MEKEGGEKNGKVEKVGRLCLEYLFYPWSHEDEGHWNSVT